jgi:OPT family oligopeptide transporter
MNKDRYDSAITPDMTSDDKHLHLEPHNEKDLVTVDNDGYVKEIQPTTDNIPHEVRAVVPSVDDPEESCETFRSYFLGCIVTIVGTGLNCWFGARQPGIYLSPLLAQFVVHPIGILFAKVLPRRHFHIANHSFTLNPGPWTVKEHTIVTMMATVSFPTATAIDIILATKLPVFFDDPELGGKLGYQFLIVLSTQFLGFGLAGMAREYLVYPSSMIWPLNLAKISLFNALHRRHFDESGEVHVTQQGPDPPVHGWKITAFRFCLYATLASFCWFFVTAFLLPFMTYFNWPTWISPTNVKLAVIMGTFTGFGLNPMPTFDWTYVSGAGLTPLITPWWATLQIFGESVRCIYR